MVDKFEQFFGKYVNNFYEITAFLNKKPEKARNLLKGLTPKSDNNTTVEIVDYFKTRAFSDYMGQKF